MAFYLITFSPTGGTRRAAGLFAQSFSKESCFVDLTDRSLAFSGIAFSEQDICLAAVPAYGGRVPHPAAARLAQMHGGGAVSYTHLDVYKRQVHTWLEAAGCTEASFFQPFTLKRPLTARIPHRKKQGSDKICTAPARRSPGRTERPLCTAQAAPAAPKDAP